VALVKCRAIIAKCITSHCPSCAAGKVDTQGAAGQPAPFPVYEDNTYSYEDHLLDMGNSPSSDAGAVAASGAEAPISAETEHNALAMRMQAITGAKPAETRATPRGPKAAQEDHPLIAVRDEVPGNGFVGSGSSSCFMSVAVEVVCYQR
jgi:hypothetical protein